MGAEARRSLYEYCRLNQKQYLLDEWDDGRNLPLTPQTITYGSKRAAWWRCANGHTWRAVLYTRTGGARCPYCTGRRVQPGFNDLASVHPELARQWDYAKNAPLVPADISAGSGRSVWWRCEKGHSWRALIRSRTAGCGCPVCAGRQLLPGENDLASVCPELAKQWDAARNGNQRPQDVLPGTEKKVWWICERGHHWRAAISMRTRSLSSCPVCAGKQVLPGFNDLASQKPALAAQWDAARNGTLTPEQVTPASNRKAWWRCEKGHSFQAVIASRANGSGCPYCTNKKVLAGFNDLATAEPKIAAEWHPTRNGALTPGMVTAGSRKRSGGSAAAATSGVHASVHAQVRSAAAAPSVQEAAVGMQVPRFCHAAAEKNTEGCERYGDNGDKLAGKGRLCRWEHSYCSAHFAAEAAVSDNKAVL